MGWVVVALLPIIAFAMALMHFGGLLPFAVPSRTVAVDQILEPLALLLVAVLAAASIIPQLQAARRQEQARQEQARTNMEQGLEAEIASIMKIMVDARIVEHFVLYFVNPSGRYPWADVARDEDYFTMFKAFADQIGLIRDAEKVLNIVRFYNYLKASRDATASVGKDADPEVARATVYEVLSLLGTMFDSGMRAVQLTDQERSLIGRAQSTIKTFLGYLPAEGARGFGLVAERLESSSFFKELSGIGEASRSL